MEIWIRKTWLMSRAILLQCPQSSKWLLHYVFVCLKSWFQVNGFSSLIRTACKRL